MGIEPPPPPIPDDELDELLVLAAPPVPASPPAPPLEDDEDESPELVEFDGSEQPHAKRVRHEMARSVDFIIVTPACALSKRTMARYARRYNSGALIQSSQ